MPGTAEKTREALSGELLSLAEVLEENVPRFHGGALKRAANSCRKPTVGGRNTWGYEITSLKFPDFEPSSNIKPRITEAGELFVEVNLRISGECSKLEDNNTDPLSSLVVDISIWGEDETKRLVGAWHLDRHLGAEEDSIAQSHPIYHMQFGGRELWREVDDYGDMLVAEAPRLAYPPLDGILVTHFVMGNFFSGAWSKLKRDREYERLIAAAQERLWRPYVEGVASAWKPGPFHAQPWPPDQLWPLLVDNYRGI